MGGKCIKSKAGDAIRPFIPPPVSKLSLSSSEVHDLLSKVTKCPQIILWDSKYDTIEKEDVQAFLISNINTDYIVDRSDCDDFSIHLCSRFREHAYRMNGTGGPLFGILTGDLRLTAENPSRPHAVCFFIDSQKQFHIVDGMWNSIHALEASMTVWTVVL